MIRAIIKPIIEHLIKAGTIGVAVDKINVGAEKAREAALQAGLSSLDDMKPDQINELYDKNVSKPDEIVDELQQALPLMEITGGADAAKQILTAFDKDTVKKVGEERLKGAITDGIGKIAGAALEAIFPGYGTIKKIIESAPDLSLKIKDTYKVYREISAIKREIEQLEASLASAPTP